MGVPCDFLPATSNGASCFTGRPTAHLHRLKFRTVRAYIRFRKHLASTFSLARQIVLDTRVFKGFGAAFIPATSSGVFCRGDYKRRPTETAIRRDRPAPRRTPRRRGPGESERTRVCWRMMVAQGFCVMRTIRVAGRGRCRIMPQKNPSPQYGVVTASIRRHPYSAA